MIRSLFAIAATVLLGVGVVSFADEGPPAAASHETFVRVCSSCHVPEIVSNKRLSREGWEEVVQMMIGRGATGTDAEMAEIVDYLAKSYPPKSAAK